MCSNSNDGIDDEEEDGPPKIFHEKREKDDGEHRQTLIETELMQRTTMTGTINEHGRTSSSQASTLLSSKNNADVEQGTTLIEMMMAEAETARKQEQKKRLQKERKNATSTLSTKNGLKRGFLNSSKKQSTKHAQGKDEDSKGRPLSLDVSKTKKKENKNIIYELDGQGNLVEPQPLDPPSNLSQTLETLSSPIAPIKPNDNVLRSKKDHLILEEVQEAMERHSLNLVDRVSEWATPDLVETFSQNPILTKGFTNPNFQSLLVEMQRNPKETIRKYSNTSKDPEFVVFIREYCRVMGEHFTKLGELKEKKEKKNRSAVQVTKDENTFEPLSTRKKKNFGPLAESAIERNRSQKQNGKVQSKKGHTSPSQEDQEKVYQIVSNPELAELLMDPTFQHILQDCGDPRKFKKYIRHPDYGPKIRKLVDAGVFQVQR